MSAATVAINGRFLAQTPSGVQRFALELVRALDRQLAGHAERGAPAVELLVPDDAASLPALDAIRVRRVAGRGGHLWDQLLRRHCSPETLLVNLANGGCVLRGNSLTVLHDAAVYRTPANFTWAYRSLHRLLGRLLALRARIATVSAFSRDELCQVLRLDGRRVPVIPNAWEHLAQVQPDAGIVARLGLTPGRYFLTIGSPAPNKNLQRAIAGFQQLGLADEHLVIVGRLDRAVFGAGLAEPPPQVLTPGRLSDAEVAGLLAQARALVFPSLYEGFGIPPLEAMLYGCPVLASDIPVVREVCGPAALLFDPWQPAAIAAAMRRAIAEPDLLRQLSERGSAQLQRYSWQHSARLLLEALRQMTPAPEPARHPQGKTAP
ncbi:MAG: glycosyl transferase [Roseateles depolymerans]|uniref:Glycosyl transferase n=1 Tax=Roseateles depolymerans TaxID=76731 RepID=A0A2W5DQN1_9BURK|nr:MAG: glycosyl transferase [Roseateles depolymerans]